MYYRVRVRYKGLTDGKFKTRTKTFNAMGNDVTEEHIKWSEEHYNNIQVLNVSINKVQEPKNKRTFYEYD